MVNGVPACSTISSNRCWPAWAKSDFEIGAARHGAAPLAEMREAGVASS